MVNPSSHESFAPPLPTRLIFAVLYCASDRVDQVVEELARMTDVLGREVNLEILQVCAKVSKKTM